MLPYLKNLQKSSQYELGIHPNFNGLFDQSEQRSAFTIIDDILSIVPRAKSYRAHALTNSTFLLKYLNEKGIRYDCNTYIPLGSMVLTPFDAPFDIKKIPFFFEDDIYFFHSKNRPSVHEYINAPGIKVFNFHPIHLFLNTESLKTYESARGSFHNYLSLKTHINNVSFGARDFFTQLIDAALNEGYSFLQIQQVH